MLCLCPNCAQFVNTTQEYKDQKAEALMSSRRYGIERVLLPILRFATRQSSVECMLSMCMCAQMDLSRHFHVLDPLLDKLVHFSRCGGDGGAMLQQGQQPAQGLQQSFCRSKHAALPPPPPSPRQHCAAVCFARADRPFRQDTALVIFWLADVLTICLMLDA